MWVFYLLSLPLTIGMVLFTLRYFAAPYVPPYVLFTVAYTWFSSLSIIILVPADIWTSLHEKIDHENGGISFFWSWSYWSTFLLTWAVVPLIQGYEDAGDFTFAARLKTSVHVNLIFYLIIGSIGLFGIILLIIMKKNWFGKGGVLGFAMASSNTFGLVTGAFLLGFGLSEIPKNIWRNADWSSRQKALSHKIAKMAVKLDDAHQEFSNAIVVAQATSNQMPKRDPLRPYMDVIDDMLLKMFKEDPSFKPQGGRLGENDMDYDTDDKSMAALRRHLRIAREEYYRCKSEYMTFVTEALEVEDVIKNYECRGATGWKFISTLRPVRSGTFGSLFDTLELIWRCILRKQLEKVLAVVLGCMSAAILLAEATLLPNRVDLFLFSRLIKSVAGEEILVQVSAFIPLMYMCVCTYFSLFKIGMLMFYSFTPSQTSSVSLLMICSMVARYAPPISYNFLNLIRLDGNKNTIFEKRMWNIDVVLPFFGTGFNKLYPLIMVVYTVMVASNFFDRVVSFMGNWKRLRFQSDADDTDGFDPSGVIILQKERSLLEQGHKVGEEVIPLARKFSPVALDAHYAPPPTITVSERASRGSSNNSREAMSAKYAPALRAEHNRVTAAAEEGRKTAATSVKVSLLDVVGNSRAPAATATAAAAAAATGTNLKAKWEWMKTGLSKLKANVGERGVMVQLKRSSSNFVASSSSTPSASESLDDIFRRLKRPAAAIQNEEEDEEEDDDAMELGFRNSSTIRYS